MYSKRKDLVRTIRTNSLFQSIPLLKRVLGENKKANSKKNSLKSSSVPRTGIEPAQYCYHWILSPARLPIPPSGPLSHAGQISHISQLVKIGQPAR